VVIATLPFAFVGSSTAQWPLVVALVLRGVGLGAVTIPVMASAYNGLDRSAIPHASIITRTVQQIGGSFGTAVLAVILERAIATHAANHPTAFDIAFWWSIGFTAIAVVIALWLPGRPTTSRSEGNIGFASACGDRSRVTNLG
jgi:hypothetical protein